MTLAGGLLRAAKGPSMSLLFTCASASFWRGRGPPYLWLKGPLSCLMSRAGMSQPPWLLALYNKYTKCAPLYLYLQPYHSK
eukprot:488323-Pyramimonas_sp.AAC.2